ncbi:hypothetical protein ACIRN4_07385 [Pimelobacter simplex]|uniref:hypothetical protein n=1 Tax=Nocardioides simplex TaxID=2045 RepID=UPI0037FFC798
MLLTREPVAHRDLGPVGPGDLGLAEADHLDPLVGCGEERRRVGQGRRRLGRQPGQLVELVAGTRRDQLGVALRDPGRAVARRRARPDHQDHRERGHDEHRRHEDRDDAAPAHRAGSSL